LEELVMRVIPTSPLPAGPVVAIPTTPAARESIAVTWSREIATRVADALGTTFEAATCRLTLRTDLPVPRTLHTTFTVAGHQVTITVVWDDPRHEPGFALTVDDRPVTVDTSSPARPAAVLAHAAWRAITDPDHHTTVRAS
jgi:hypothetical protein